MKKSLKFFTSMLAVTLLFTACSTTTKGTTVGTINGKDITVPYFEEIFKAENSEDSTNTEESNPAVLGLEEDEIEYDETSALLVSLVGQLFKTTGNGKVDRQKLNATLNNLKGSYGDKYLEEASNKYKLPIKTEDDLIQVLTFSVLYSNYLEKIANITDDQISEEYLKTYATKYCADNIVVKEEADATKLLALLQSGEKTFEDFMTEAEAAQNASGTPQQTQQGAPATVSADNVLISGVMVSQISDLGCQPASMYVPTFADALSSMQDGTYSSEPVKSDYGYHIINLRKTEKTPLDKTLQKTIKESLLGKKQQEAGFSSYYLLALFDESEISITNEAFKKVYDEYYDELKAAAEDYKPIGEETTNNEESSSTNE